MSDNNGLSWSRVLCFAIGLSIAYFVIVYLVVCFTSPGPS